VDGPKSKSLIFDKLKRPLIERDFAFTRITRTARPQDGNAAAASGQKAKPVTVFVVTAPERHIARLTERISKDLESLGIQEGSIPLPSIRLEKDQIDGLMNDLKEKVTDMLEQTFKHLSIDVKSTTKVWKKQKEIGFCCLALIFPFLDRRAKYLMARLTGGVDEEPPALSIQAAEASIAAAVQSSDSGYGYRQSVLADSGRDSASIASDSRVSASVWSIAHFVTHHTQLFIYGGYLRDFFIRGDVHGEMHLDVGFDSQHGKPPRPQLSPPLPNMAEARREWDRVVEWGKESGVCKQVYRETRSKLEVLTIVAGADNQTRLQVELVDVASWREKTPVPDTDVNALMLGSDGKLALKHSSPPERLVELCGSVQRVVAHILQRARHQPCLVPPAEAGQVQAKRMEHLFLDNKSVF